METRGVKKGTKREKYVKYTDQEIIDVISRYETITDLRSGEDVHFYFLAKRRGLGDYLPPKRTRAMNLVGSAAQRKREAKEEKIRIKEEKAKLKEEKYFGKQENKSKKEPKEDTTTANRMYRCQRIDEETIYCGRCLKETNDISKHNSHLCRKCYSRYLYLRKIGKDTNPHNIKDEYCHIVINHHEKCFRIGIKVDERTQRYLTSVGYSFLFKEEN